MLELDQTDSRILRVLMEDGRSSFRAVSRKVGVTTPTVQARVKRMVDSGLIRSISPVFDSSKMEQGVASLISLRAKPSEIENLAERLTKRSEVKGIYLTTGLDNVLLRVVVESLEQLREFAVMLETDFGVKEQSSQMIVRSFKDEQGVLVKAGLNIRLQCETCSGPVTGKPYIMNVAGRERYFCCGTCLGKFREKYETRLKGLSITVQTPRSR